MAWSSLYSAQQLIVGQWLGSLGNFSLLAKPGFSLWIALNHLLGLPLALGSIFFLGLAAMVFAFALRRLGVSRIFVALIFAWILFDPLARDAIARISALSLRWPLILLASSCYFLSTYQENMRRKELLWALSGGWLAIYWITFTSPLIPLALLGWMLIWEIALQPPQPLRRRLLPILPLLLMLTIPVALADLPIRIVNQVKYGEFLLQKKIRSGQSLSSRIKDAPSPEWLLGELDLESGETLSEIRGWAAQRYSPVRRIELLDETGRIVGATEELLGRPDVSKHLREQKEWEVSGDAFGFRISAPSRSFSKESSALVFHSADGTRLQIGFEHPGGESGPHFLYYLDSIETKIPEPGWRALVESYIYRWYARSLGVLGIVMVLGGALLVGAKLGGQGPKPGDFWLFLFALLILFCLESAMDGGLRDFTLLRERAWPLAALVGCQALILLERAWMFHDREPGPAQPKATTWRAEGLFLAYALGFGGLFVLVNPPFQAADEIVHAFRSTQISQGQIEKDAAIPSGMGELAGRYGRLIFHPENKMHFREILANFKVPLRDHDRRHLNSTNTNPIGYLPQAIGIFIGRLAGLPPLALIYLGRFCNLLFWSSLVFLAIRRLPLFNWVFFFLALSPMGLYQAASFSYDAFTNGVIFLLIATLLYHAFGKGGRLTNLQIVELILLGISASLVKVVYFPIILLYFWIPFAKLGSKLRYFLVFGVLAASSFGIDFLWNSTKGGAIRAVFRTETKPIYGEWSFILDRPWDFLALIWNTLKQNYEFYLESFIGKLGWLETALPKSVLLFYGLTLCLLVYRDRKAGIRFGAWPKVLSLSIFFSIFLLLLTGFFLGWTRQGASAIEGIQGRYFIPIVPLLLLFFYNNQAGENSDRFAARWAPSAAAIVLLATGVALLRRYYYL